MARIATARGPSLSLGDGQSICPQSSTVLPPAPRSRHNQNAADVARVFPPLRRPTSALRAVGRSEARPGALGVTRAGKASLAPSVWAEKVERRRFPRFRALARKCSRVQNLPRCAPRTAPPRQSRGAAHPPDTATRQRDPRGRCGAARAQAGRRAAPAHLAPMPPASPHCGVHAGSPSAPLTRHIFPSPRYLAPSARPSP